VNLVIEGDALDLIHEFEPSPDLIVTDPPYAFGGSGGEHALSSTVAIVLRESAKKLKRGGWMVVFCAHSWRSMAYMVESVRRIVEPVRVGTWCKPQARTKAQTPGWQWASVAAIAFRKGKGVGVPSEILDHITCAPVTTGRRATLPYSVAEWAVKPFAIPGGVFLDPFCGSGVLLVAAEKMDMCSYGFERDIPT
jgi:hypothetical protein